jgi:hypothetical protein
MQEHMYTLNDNDLLVLLNLSFSEGEKVERKVLRAFDKLLFGRDLKHYFSIWPIKESI